ncbi:acyltransferase [Parvibaculum sp.]|uniref:acyltransferase family protein n=1 Tax=Parvibaculum sp. TaxID=2024848 RepID=UPI002BD05214|nr:acyltransferase [Parvibaculum sp.]HUD49991.1 acyltransferase [Parvibaculum sp.]
MAGRSEAHIAGTHINCLDGLRGIAALWVLVGHAMLLSGWFFPLVSRPGLAVDLFILLSGFLMLFHYELREKAEPWDKSSTWAIFWTRRFFRIAPLYYPLLALALIAGPWIGDARADIAAIMQGTATPPARYADRGLDNIVAHLTFVFGQMPHYAFRTALPDWSIGLEMSFYAAFPFIMLLVKRFTLPLTALALAALSIAILKLLPEYVAAFEQPAFLPMKLNVFLAGMLIAGARTRPDRLCLFMVALAILLSMGPIRTEPVEHITRAAMAAGFAFLVHGPRFLGVSGAAKWTDDFLGRAVFRRLGDLSYGVYLIHLLVLIPAVAQLAGTGLRGFPLFLASAALTVATAYPVAWLGFAFIEQPGIALGKRLLRRSRTRVRRAPLDVANPSD